MSEFMKLQEAINNVRFELIQYKVRNNVFDLNRSELLQVSKLLSEYSKRAQYLLISHNDGIISEAENLYGISMDEHGLSKVVSLKI